MGFGQTLENWVEGLSAKWKERLAGWMSSWVEKGLLELIEGIEPEAIETMQSSMSKLAANPNLPPEIKAIISKATTPGKPLPLLLLIPIAAIMFIPMIMSIAAPLGRLLEYQEDKLLHSARFDPAQAITAWRRDPGKYEALFQDLRDLGWSDDKIEAWKFLTLAFPGVQDIIRFAVREVYSPEIAERFGQFEDFPTRALEDASKVGISDEVLRKYWAAHWDLPSAGQGFEMLHRGVITESDLELLLRALDVMPFWRDKLTAISWNVPTRVDIRRFYDLGVIDDARLRELYQMFGYHGADLDNIVEFTKRYVNREKTVTEKELTKAEIIKGVKKGVISWDEGVSLLKDLDYGADTADFILAINLAAAAGSPETYDEYKDITEKWRLSMGMSAKPVPEELKAAGRELISIKAEVKTLEDAVKEEEAKLIPGEVLPAEATTKLDELKASLARANTKLVAAKTHYDSVLAQWKHGV
jgi:hypothetical protein